MPRRPWLRPRRACVAGWEHILPLMEIILRIFSTVIWFPYPRPSRFVEPRPVRVPDPDLGAPSHLSPTYIRAPSSSPTCPSHSDTHVQEISSFSLVDGNNPQNIPNGDLSANELCPVRVPGQISAPPSHLSLAYKRVPPPPPQLAPHI